MKKFAITALAAAISLYSIAPSAALMFVHSQLTGDHRAPNDGVELDQMVIDVSIVSDTTWNYADWTIDVNSPAHPNIRIRDFQFNLAGTNDDYVFTNFNLDEWSVEDDRSTPTAPGASFMFTARDTEHGYPYERPTNEEDLTFRMELVSGLMSPSVFSEASYDVVGGISAQIAAYGYEWINHCEKENGVAIGNFTVEGGTSVIEPGSFTLLLAGFIGMYFVGRHNDKKREEAKG